MLFSLRAEKYSETIVFLIGGCSRKLFFFSMRAEKKNEAAYFTVVYFTNHPVAYVVGGRVGMDDSRLIRSN